MTSHVTSSESNELNIERSDSLAANPAMTPASNHPRYVELDSLRGIAALTVVVGHFAQVMLCSPSGVHKDWDVYRSAIKALNRTPFCFFLNGGPAVRFFFVLSAFVLALPWLTNSQPSYPIYVLRRGCRIYLPYLAALALAIGIISLIGGYILPGFTGAMLNTWTDKPRFALVLQHVLVIGSYPSARYNEVAWSLVQELRISLIFPVLAMIVIRIRPIFTVGIILIIEMASLGLALDPQVPLDLDGFAMTLHFISLFLAGICLALHKDRLSDVARSMSRRSTLWLFVLAFLGYSMVTKTLTGEQFESRVVLPILNAKLLGPFNSLSFVRFALQILCDWISAFGAAVAIVFAITSARLKRILHSRFIVKLGQASYSLYLVHATVLYGLLYLLINTKFVFLYLPLYLGGTLVVTWIFYQRVEIPSIRLGKILARKPKSRLHLRDQSP